MEFGTQELLDNKLGIDKPFVGSVMLRIVVAPSTIGYIAIISIIN
jgi:hypothetical protein